jgi:hypothetical protein
MGTYDYLFGDPANEIYILSGEGCGSGNRVLYCGAKSVRAIKARLTRERCGGDRWAKVLVQTPNDSGPQDVTDKLCS